MPEFEIWIEGHQAQGSHGKAKMIARVEADNFVSACNEFALTPKAKDYGNFDREQLTFWGCKLFDNEKDARKSFG
jgi:hypothetical protein